MPSRKTIVPVGRIESRILPVREEKMIIDADLTPLYGMPTRRLKERIRRNRQRSPSGFMFRLTAEEKIEVVANCEHLSGTRFSKVRPYAFAESGAIMATSAARSRQASAS